MKQCAFSLHARMASVVTSSSNQRRAQFVRGKLAPRVAAAAAVAPSVRLAAYVRCRSKCRARLRESAAWGGERRADRAAMTAASGDAGVQCSVCRS